MVCQTGLFDLLVQAYSKDTGAISYTWKRQALNEDNTGSGEEITVIESTNQMVEVEDLNNLNKAFSYYETNGSDADGNPTVKGMPLQLFVYGVGENFEIPEHVGFKASDIMRIVGYISALLLMLCFVGILINVVRGFKNGLFFNRLQVVLLRWSSLLYFISVIAAELCSKFNMSAIGQIYGKSSSVELAAAYQIEIQQIIIPFLLLLFAEIINIAMQLNKEESMTI